MLLSTKAGSNSLFGPPIRDSGLPSGGDWALQRSAAVTAIGTTNFSLADCYLRALGVQPDETIPAWMDETDELMIVRRICNSPSCNSPRGPGFDASGFMSTRGGGDQREWRLIACSSCGQSAIHPGCARNLSESWRCDDCGGGVKGSDEAASEVVAFRVGDVVEARWRGGSKWFPGHIRKLDTSKETRWLVAYSDGDTEWVDRAIRLRRPKHAKEAPVARITGCGRVGFYKFFESERASIDEELGDMAELSGQYSSISDAEYDQLCEMAAGGKAA